MKNILKEIRKGHNLTQSQLAEKLGVGRGTIAQIEIGKNSITSELAKKISDIFNYTTDLILNYKGENLELIHTDENSYVGDFFKDVDGLSLELDKFKMLKLIIQEFSKEKRLKGITPAYDRFNMQNNFDNLVKEFQSKLERNEIDNRFEKEFSKKLKFATESLFDDLYNNMSVAYNMINNYYKM
jgi:transcriptional regulator with XRE-family HTH domain